MSSRVHHLDVLALMTISRLASATIAETDMKGLVDAHDAFGALVFATITGALLTNDSYEGVIQHYNRNGRDA